MNKIFNAAFLIFFAANIYGQNNLKNTVILYNVVPLRVDLNPDGTIQTIYGQDNKFLKGYTIVKPVDKRDENQNQNYSNDLKGYYVVSNDAYDLNFQADKATLSESAIQSLDKTADAVFFDGHKAVVNSYKVPQDSKNQTLYKNRLNAILTYLEIKGVSKDKIIINLDEYESTQESFKITFVKG